MRILQLCVRFPPVPGGAEAHVYNISKELLKRGHDVKVFTSDLYTEVPFVRLKNIKPTYDGISVRRFRSYSLGGDMHYVFIPCLLRAIMKEDVDIIHTHSYGYFHTNMGAFGKRMMGIPLVITPHFHPAWSMWGGARRKKLRRIYDSLFARPVLNSADAIIGVSGHEIELMKETGFKEKNIRIIPNGIDFSGFDPIPEGEVFREKYGISGTMILYSGRLASNKGLKYLVEAAPRVLSEFGDSTFVLVGSDEGERAQLEERARELGIRDRFVFTGHIDSNELFRSAYSACDVFVLPSEYEAFGIVLLEAMACERPCVGTKVGGVPEVIEEGKTGLLVDYGNPEQLADALIELLGDDPRRREMGKAGRVRVRERFTWPKVVDQLEEVYRGLV